MKTNVTQYDSRPIQLNGCVYIELDIANKMSSFYDLCEIIYFAAKNTHIVELIRQFGLFVPTSHWVKCLFSIMGLLHTCLVIKSNLSNLVKRFTIRVNGMEICDEMLAV